MSELVGCNLNCVCATFWSSNLIFQCVCNIPLCLQHFGARTFNVPEYFATRVHLYKVGLCFCYGLFQAGSVGLGIREARKQRSRERQKNRKAKSREAEQ